MEKNIELWQVTARVGLFGKGQKANLPIRVEPSNAIMGIKVTFGTRYDQVLLNRRWNRYQNVQKMGMTFYLER